MTMFRFFINTHNGIFLREHIYFYILVCFFSWLCEEIIVSARSVESTSWKSDLRSITLTWEPVSESENDRANSSDADSQAFGFYPRAPVSSPYLPENSTVKYLVKYCEDSPWDDDPIHCYYLLTNETHIHLASLRPATKYLLTVDTLPLRGPRIIPMDPPNNIPHPLPAQLRLDRRKAVAAETQKYAVRNVQCLKGQTIVQVETGDSFDGLISVQRPDNALATSKSRSGSNERCSLRGSGHAEQLYNLTFNHSDCNVEFLQNGTIMNAIIMIQEHAGLVLGTDQSFRISCNYLPAVIMIQTGMGMDSQRQVIRIDPGTGLTPDTASDSVGITPPAIPASPTFLTPASSWLRASQQTINFTLLQPLTHSPDSPRSRTTTSEFSSTIPPTTSTPPRTALAEEDEQTMMRRFYGSLPSNMEKQSDLPHSLSVPAVEQRKDTSRVISPTEVNSPSVFRWSEDATTSHGIQRDFPIKLYSDRSHDGLHAVATPSTTPRITAQSPYNILITANPALPNRMTNHSNENGADRPAVLQKIVVGVAGALSGVVLLSITVWLLLIKSGQCPPPRRRRFNRTLSDNERYA